VRAPSGCSVRQVWCSGTFNWLQSKRIRPAATSEATSLIGRSVENAYPRNKSSASVSEILACTDIRPVAWCTSMRCFGTCSSCQATDSARRCISVRPVKEIRMRPALRPPTHPGGIPATVRRVRRPDPNRSGSIRPTVMHTPALLLVSCEDASRGEWSISPMLELDDVAQTIPAPYQRFRAPKRRDSAGNHPRFVRDSAENRSARSDSSPTPKAALSKGVARATNKHEYLVHMPDTRLHCRVHDGAERWVHAGQGRLPVRV
jgi:hypothetical protein